MNPNDRKYTEDHEWVQAEGNEGTVGITDHAQEQLGDIVYVDLPEPGTVIAPGNVLLTIESVKSVSDVYSPVAGKVTEVNERLLDEPELVNTDAYGQGWLAKIEFSAGADLEGLLSVEKYEEKIGS